MTHLLLPGVSIHITKPYLKLSDVQMSVIRDVTTWKSVYLLLTKAFNKTGSPHVIQLTDLHAHVIVKHLYKTTKSTIPIKIFSQTIHLAGEYRNLF